MGLTLVETAVLKHRCFDANMSFLAGKAAIAGCQLETEERGQLASCCLKFPRRELYQGPVK